MQRSRAVAAMAAAVLGVAGCGGGGDDSGLTRAQLVRRADAICSKFDAQNTRMLKALYAEAKTNTSKPARMRILSEFLTQQAANERRANTALAALGPLRAVQTAFGRYLAIRRERIALAPSAAERMAGRDSHRAQEHALALTAFRLRRDIGLKVCT